MKNNTGKKYIKLRGDEVPTPENEKRAGEFLAWYAENMDRLKRYAGHPVDDDLFSDTMLRIYDMIALKGARIKDYTGYFLQAYRGVFLNSEKKKSVFPEKPPGQDIPAPDTAQPDEEAAEAINDEILEYVRGNFTEVESILFEIYLGLLLSKSDTRIPRIFKLPPAEVWGAISRIRKRINDRFQNGFFLSIA